MFTYTDMRVASVSSLVLSNQKKLTKVLSKMSFTDCSPLHALFYPDRSRGRWHEKHSPRLASHLQCHQWHANQCHHPGHSQLILCGLMPAWVKLRAACTCQARHASDAILSLQNLILLLSLKRNWWKNRQVPFSIFCLATEVQYEQGAGPA